MPHEMHYCMWSAVPLQQAEKIVICLHGFTRNGRDFDMLASHLASAHNYTVLCPDIAGRGKTAWLSDPRDYHYSMYEADIYQLIETLPSQAEISVLGTSMGGLIAMSLQADKGTRIARLIINDVGVFIPGFSLHRIGQYVGQGLRHESKADAMAWLKQEMQSFSLPDAAAWEHVFFHHFHKNDAGEYVAHYDPAIGLAFWNKRGVQRKMYDMDYHYLWQKIDCPMLLLRGEMSDLLLHDTAIEMAQKQHVTLHTFSGCGHAPHLMDQEQIQVISEWLAQP